MKTKVILLNAPKLVGKDHAADYVIDRIDEQGLDDIGFKMMFKDPLYTITAAIYTVPREELIKDATDRTTKEVPMVKYRGKSPREALIHTSEEIIKPHFGKTFFGDASVKVIDKILENFVQDGVGQPFFIFSDSGFSEEAYPIIDYVGVDNVLIIRIHRDGHTFEGDSRRYLMPDDVPDSVAFLDVHNDRSLEDFEERMYTEVLQFIKNP